MIKRLSTIENLTNLHVALWLLKDSAWCSLWRGVGLLFAVPTVILAFVITWKTRKTLSDLIHNGAVCFWICANVVWMIGEFYYQDQTRWLARGFFGSGLVLLAVYYLWEITRKPEKSSC